MQNMLPLYKKEGNKNVALYLHIYAQSIIGRTDRELILLAAFRQGSSVGSECRESCALILKQGVPFTLMAFIVTLSKLLGFCVSRSLPL